MKRLNECSCGCGGNGGCNDNDSNYMFFGNLKTIKKYVDALLELDPNQVQEILSDGHDWAADHIATSKDDIQEVGDFLMNEMHHDAEQDSYNMQQPQFVPVDFKNHLKKLMPERIEKTEAGIYLPEKLRDRYITGSILATGDDVNQVEHNCKVVFEKSLARETVIMGESLFIIKENQILYKLV